MAQPTHRVRLLERQARVEDVVSFRFERPAGYEYEAGQWLVITFARPDRAEPYTHHFSHSSSPYDPFVEFTTRLRGSEFKNALAALPDGTEVEIEAPYGAFTLPVDVPRVAFLTGGIGITCVRSILRRVAEDWERGRTTEQRLVLLFANRSKEAIAFCQELDQMDARLPVLRVVHVLSRADESWRGDRGHIDQALLSRELGDTAAWTYYLSGPPGMVAGLRELLTGQGVAAASIRMERFEGYE